MGAIKMHFDELLKLFHVFQSLVRDSRPCQNHQSRVGKVPEMPQVRIGDVGARKIDDDNRFKKRPSKDQGKPTPLGDGRRNSAGIVLDLDLIRYVASQATDSAYRLLLTMSTIKNKDSIYKHR